MRKRNLTWIVVLLLVVVGGGGLWWWLHVKANRSIEAKAAPTIPVSVATATRRDVPLYLQGLGNVQAFNTVTIRTQVDGELHQVIFKEGQEVHVGDLLAQIDPRTYQAALDQAVAKKAEDDAQLTNARLDLQRYAGLVDKNYISRQQLDTAQAQVTQFEATVKGDDAAIESARVTLGYTSIKSPIEARVGIRQVDIGNIVHPTDANGIVVLTQMHPISVLFTLPEDSVPNLVKAMAGGAVPVAALSRDSKQKLDDGVLQLVDNEIDQTTGTVRLKATMPNSQGLLWPGQFVNAKIQVGTLKNVVTVPIPVVQRGPDGAFGYVVTAAGTVEMRKLTLGEVSEGMYVIQAGIQEGDQVVTAGQYRLQAGSHVSVAGPSAPAAPPAKAE